LFHQDDTIFRGPQEEPYIFSVGETEIEVTIPVADYGTKAECKYSAAGSYDISVSVDDVGTYYDDDAPEQPQPFTVTVQQ